MAREYHYQATATATHHDAFRCACGYASGVVVTATALGGGRIGDADDLYDADKTSNAEAQAQQRASENASDEARTLVVLFALGMMIASLVIGMLSLFLYPLIVGIWLWLWISNYRNADKLVRFDGIAPPPPATAPARLPLPG